MLLALSILSFLFIKTYAQTSSNILLSGSQSIGSSVSNLGGDLLPTGSEVSYVSYSTTSTVNGSATLLATTFAVANDSSRSSERSSTSTSISLLHGSIGATTTSSLNGSASRNSTARMSSTSSAAPTNTQACNNYPEFCNRKYSNITYIGAHNSPFVNPNNAAANQALDVTHQLDDGIRMVTGETHYNATTNTISYCHTSCNLLNAGTAEQFFTNVTNWIKTHPYDVVTLLLVNSDFIGVGNYTAPLINSGLANYAYTPPQVPMNISSWPTLSSMILMGKRAVIFMDYNANQTEVPYIIDEFGSMWETPFSPTNRSFPCTEQRPPGLNQTDAEQRMYLANHNLNTEISLAGTSLLVPTTSLLNETNGLNGTGSLGLMANNCAALWPQPPNFLLVDYYNQGSYPGSVFEVAAQQNNVTYSRPCCGFVASTGYSLTARTYAIVLIGISSAALLFLQ